MYDQHTMIVQSGNTYSNTLVLATMAHQVSKLRHKGVASLTELD